MILVLGRADRHQPWRRPTASVVLTQGQYLRTYSFTSPYGEGHYHHLISSATTHLRPLNFTGGRAGVRHTPYENLFVVPSRMHQFGRGTILLVDTHIGDGGLSKFSFWPSTASHDPADLLVESATPATAGGVDQDWGRLNLLFHPSKGSQYIGVGAKWLSVPPKLDGGIPYNHYIKKVQVEKAHLGETFPSPYEAARQVNVVVRPDRINLVVNPVVPVGVHTTVTPGVAYHGDSWDQVRLRSTAIAPPLWGEGRGNSVNMSNHINILGQTNGTYTTATVVGDNQELDVRMEDPPGPLTPYTQGQTIVVTCKKNAAGGVNPTIRIELREGTLTSSTLIRSWNRTVGGSSPAGIGLSWEGNSITDPTKVIVRLVQDDNQSSQDPVNRRSVEFDSVQWMAQYWQGDTGSGNNGFKSVSDSVTLRGGEKYTTQWEIANPTSKAASLIARWNGDSGSAKEVTILPGERKRVHVTGVGPGFGEILNKTSGIDYILVREVMTEKGVDLNPFFNGSTNEDTVWEGDVLASRSHYYNDRLVRHATINRILETNVPAGIGVGEPQFGVTPKDW